MRTKTIELYSYSELSEESQAKAREWLRECKTGDNFFAEHTSEEFAELLAALGFDISQRPNFNSGRGNTISWSGFGSQGDGAAFSGTWRAELCTPSEWLDARPATYRKRDKRGRQYGPAIECESNKAWHDAAAPIIELAKAYPAGYAVIRDSNHGFFMSLGDYEFQVVDPDKDYGRAEWVEFDVANKAAGEKLIEAARDLAAEFYHNLETEWEYQNSDEQIAESIEANEYEFTSDGSIA